MTREERRCRRRRGLAILLAAALVLLCFAVSQCGDTPEPGVVAVATAMRAGV